MLNNHIESSIFQAAIQKLTFSYCISSYDLCDFAFRATNPYLLSNTKYEKLQKEDRINNFKRYGNILLKLCIETHKKKAVNFLMKQPKIYDEFLLESQIRLYNNSAELLGYAPIEKILPVSLIKSAAFLDGATPSYEDIAKYYPYYPDENRDGVNFIEFILLINIYATVRSRSLFMLNKPIETNYDKQRIRRIVTSLIKNIESEEMFIWYVHAFLDIFECVINTMHNEKAEDYIRVAWLPEELKNRKDVFRAFDTHKKEELKITTAKYETSQIENIIKREKGYEQMRLFRTMLDYNAVEFIGCEILPVAFSILTGVEKKNNLPVDQIIMTFAESYACAIRNYIEQAISEAINILNELYINNL